jgi:predicted Zn-dependent protease
MKFLTLLLIMERNASAAQLQGLGAVGVAVATGGKVQKLNKHTNLWCWFTSRSNVVYSRNHETEADKIGLVLMAVGYNPDQISFWTRMAVFKRSSST